ncbi:hypothetical protein [Oligella urethralis]|uniref:hypothetical protein n=1 Tax=Oligella urethralis TaxID=90245 RepID=UPI0027B9134E|nr:hypothetical protein [Oligella urethralis]
MQYKRALKFATLSAVVLALSACETFAFKSNEAADADQKVVAAKTPQAAPVSPVIAKRQGTNELAIYVGSKNAKKSAKEQSLKVGDTQYYTSGIVLKRDDIQNAFVAKTLSDEPALALRLKPDSIAKLSKARKGYSHILASINGNVISTVEGANSNLMDSVLLMPMPTLVSARDAADLIR